MTPSWIALAVAFVLGCARPPEAPAREGERCAEDADCNRGDGGATRACGRLRLCVAGRCELDAGSRLVACRDAG